MSKGGRRPRSRVDHREVDRLREQVKSIKRFGAFSATSKVLCEAMRASRVIIPCMFLWLAVRDWPAHKLEADVKAHVSVESESIADALKSLLTEGTLWGLLALLAVSGVGYGKYQAKLRRDDVERLSRYKELYEKLQDPQRSSSRLTARGETRPEDE